MMYEVYRWVDGEWYYWGRWSDRNRANEVALELRDTCDGVWVKEVQA
jgi:hypothetical protein